MSDENYIGPPRLKDFSCHVNVDDDSSPDSKAVCVLNCVLNQNKCQPSEIENKNSFATNTGEINVAFSLTPSVLDTLLDSLHHIQQQLSASATSAKTS